MPHRRQAAAAAAALATTLVVALPPAFATRTVRIASRISIQSRMLTFSGRVDSANAACDAGRRVTLYRSNGNVLGHARTGAGGRWRITATGSAGITLGRFFARVARRAEGTAGTIYVCRAATSRTIAYHQ